MSTIRVTLRVEGVEVADVTPYFAETYVLQTSQTDREGQASIVTHAAADLAKRVENYILHKSDEEIQKAYKETQ